MKKIIKAIKNKINKIFTSVKTIVVSIKDMIASVKLNVLSTAGEGYIDTGVKIIIGVVIGGVILAGLYTIFNSTIIPTLSQKIQGMFNYGG